jgi:type I restriction enzyme R subunit
MGVHENMAMKVLSNESVAKGFAELMFDVLMKGMKNNISSN